VEQGRSVTAATRQVEPVALRGLPVETVRLDARWSALAAVARGHDVVVDAAAPYPLDPCVPGSPAWAMAIDEAAQHARCVEDAARSAGATLVFVSSFTTLPRNELPVMAAQAAWRRGMYPYFAAKELMERIVLDAAATGLQAVVINPAACLGPWEYRSAGSSFVRLVMERRLPMVMDRVLSVIDVRDVAAAIDAALEGEMFGRPIALAGHNIHLAELARQILVSAGMPCVPPIPVDPQAASLAALSVAAGLAAMNQRAPDVWRAVPLIADSFPMSPSPEETAMGLSLRSLSDTLLAAVAFHRGTGCR
jgi:dihydroflavonol-4-reductase